MIAQIKAKLKEIQLDPEVSVLAFRQGQSLYLNGQCQLLTQAGETFEFAIDDEYDDFIVTLHVADDKLVCLTQKAQPAPIHHTVACLSQLAEEMERVEAQPNPIGKAYTREGMIRRVMQERESKALKAEYRVAFADNPYGEHVLINEKEQQYKITFRDMEKETGYCSCMDYRTNKLGTCKHLMFAFFKKKGNKQFLRKPKTAYPFVEIFLDPLNDNRISWFYPDELEEEVKALIQPYFGDGQVLPAENLLKFLDFMAEADEHKHILIRPEVFEKVEKAYDRHMLESISETHEIDLSPIKATLFPYQERGVQFATFKEGVIIADEMGLGKTIQAMATAIMKKQLFGFSKTLVVCPASVKHQWAKEIRKFSDEKAVVVEGYPKNRHLMYKESDAFFLIINYETVLRDRQAINDADIDFIILDEAQRIKNYDTITARSIKALKKKHALVITGTPIENRLIDLFSIMDFIDPYFLTPLWEFSYQHCYFDLDKKNKITGYHNLQNLKERLQPILLRRQKREVLKELPNITEIDVPVDMSLKQREYHANAASGVAAILRKKFITAFDMNRLMMLLNQMRMACDSTFLVDKETNISPKLTELEHILIEKLDIENSDRKIIIFSEWVRMNGLIGKMLRDKGISYVELSGKVPVKKRQLLVDEFKNNPDCQIFLSSEAGGTGLNLQSADTVINFELPWNPAKKNQRIGRIDRIGQTAEHLTVINLITRNSIEMQIATGLELKQNLFESVLNENSKQDVVDFSKKGRSQFLKQLEAAIEELNKPGPAEGMQVEEEALEELEALIASEVENGAGDVPVPQTATGSTEHEDSPEATPASVSSGSPESTPQEGTASPQTEAVPAAQRAEEMQQVMNQGMSFLGGLFKMATGKDMGLDSKSIEVDPNTGEIVMRFKMPM